MSAHKESNYHFPGSRVFVKCQNHMKKGIFTLRTKLAKAYRNITGQRTMQNLYLRVKLMPQDIKELFYKKASNSVYSNSVLKETDSFGYFLENV